MGTTTGSSGGSGGASTLGSGAARSNRLSCESADSTGFLFLRRDGEPVDPDPKPSLAPDDVAVLELADLEPVEHPADRRLRVAPFRIDRSGDDQAVDRARHRDVVEAEPLGLVRRLLGVPDRLVGEGGEPLSRQRVDDLEAEAAVREADDLLPAGRQALPPGVGDDHDLELEALRGMDGQQPDGAGTFFLRDRLQLLDAGCVLLGDETDEAFDVRPAQLLVRAGEAGELPHVGVAAAAVPLGEDGQVVVVLDDDLLAQTLEPHVAGQGGEPLVPLLERLEESLGRARRGPPASPSRPR